MIRKNQAVSQKKRSGKQRAGIVIAAPKSGSGKTMITCAVIQALCNRHKSICSYKCGPDYIDPMFHRTILGVSGGNLDTFFTEEEKTKELFLEQTGTEDMAIVEGVMGLYDGMGGTREEGSTYHVAKILQLPIILVIDAHGMGRSILSEIAGFLAYDKEHLIRGVILNRVRAPYYPVLEELIEQELEIEVFGFFPEAKELTLESRHLGLKRPEEIHSIMEQMRAAAQMLEACVNVDRLIELGEDFEKGMEREKAVYLESSSASEERQNLFKRGKKLILAVAKDEAFCFYYQENLAMLSKAGFQIREFSPMHDRRLPEGTSAILLGGGYPELYAKELAENTEMKAAVREAILAGIPSVAECGGFMYLHKELKDDKGVSYPMAGMIDGSCAYQGKLVRFGYVSIQEKNSSFLEKDSIIRGHEFHYYDSTRNGESCMAAKPTGNRKWDCVIETELHWWGFPHLYYPSNPSFVERFYAKAENGTKKQASYNV